ncbi:unnamed protein product [Coffea canephora]|uniref:phosphatidylglycerophosphatase n=2 Tax=Coffea TaxID=13442 RepID=A0A068UN86_COFCA|nr:putative dual specificity protein phosphatase DSP8 [Coffea arabica]CDP10010.1 unnamed protein product [Coffea canephora]
MRIEELGGEEEGLEIAERPEEEEKEVAKSAASGEAVHNVGDSGGGGGGGGDIVLWSTKKVLVGAGARALFYPTLLYNVVRNKVQAEFRWWDWIDEFVLLGAVPFRSDVSELKDLGIGAVVTLNEPYETLVPTSLYQAHGIHHLVLPTRDYLFAPSLDDICRAVDFIHENASCGQSTYVHCKAGRGRSTTIVICFLVKFKQMTPDVAYNYVKSIRPRVHLASSQWQAVQEFHYVQVRTTCASSLLTDLVLKSSKLFSSRDLLAFDDGSAVIITNSDLAGYDPNQDPVAVRNEIWADVNFIYRVKVAGAIALTKLSCLWLRCHTQQKVLGEELTGESSCLTGAEQLGDITVDIHVYSS